MILILFLFFYSIGLADYLGGHSGSGFRYGTNARSMALGNAIISAQNEGFNAFSNPALLASVKKREIGLTQFSLSLDRFVQVFSLSQSINDDAGVSLSFFNSGVKGIVGKDFSNQSTGEFNSNEGFIMLSAGADINDKLNLGLNVKTIFTSIDKYSANGISVDFGLIYNFNSKLLIGLKMTDLLSKYTWDGLDDSSSSFEEDMPTTNSIGFHFSPSSDIETFYNLEHYNVANSSYYRNRFGLEIKKWKYSFRGGIVQNRGTGKYDFRYLFGIGSELGTVQNHKVRLDYCIDLGKENEGISNLFTLTFEK